MASVGPYGPVPRTTAPASSEFTSTGVDKCNSPTSPVRRRCPGRRPCLRQRIRRLSGKGHHHRGADRCGRRQRCDGARHRPGHVGDPQAARHRRQQGGRQRRHRQRIRHARPAGRLHADAGLYRDARDEPVLAEAALRPGQGLRAGRHGRFVGHADGGEPDSQGQQREGSRGDAQGHTRQDQLRVGRQRHGAAFRGRDVQALDRHRNAARAVQGFCTGDQQTPSAARRR